ncbi:MAG TPA: hypothetical protein VNJ09_00635 [Chthonomonadales bacterium]|jgi:hypothetical protein|nr:hypothetical protein [Chthonomonadales bacterium]
MSDILHIRFKRIDEGFILAPDIDLGRFSSLEEVIECLKMRLVAMGADPRSWIPDFAAGQTFVVRVTKYGVVHVHAVDRRCQRCGHANRDRQRVTCEVCWQEL